MNSAALHDRHRYVQGLRDYADWLESDHTIPAPNDLLTGVRLATAGDVEAFARIHRLGDTAVNAHGQTYASKRFGPVTYRAYTVPAVKAVAR
jgi:hypothetical protein